MWKKITISGPAGSGKTTVASLLAEKLNVDLISAGTIFRNLAKDAHLSLEEFSRLAERDWDIDRSLDTCLLELLRKKKTGVFEARLAGYLAYIHGIKSLKVYLDAPEDVRIRRIMRREKKGYVTTRKQMTQRERSEHKRYRSIYGVDVNDTSFFDLVIDSSMMTPEKVVERIIQRAKD